MEKAIQLLGATAGVVSILTVLTVLLDVPYLEMPSAMIEQFQIVFLLVVVIIGFLGAVRLSNS